MESGEEKIVLETAYLQNLLPHIEKNGKLKSHVSSVDIDCQICSYKKLAITEKPKSKTHEKWTVLPCGHMFGFKCIGKWLASTYYPECPVCRQRMTYQRCRHVFKPQEYSCAIEKKTNGDKIKVNLNLQDIAKQHDINSGEKEKKNSGETAAEGRNNPCLPGRCADCPGSLSTAVDSSLNSPLLGHEVWQRYRLNIQPPAAEIHRDSSPYIFTAGDSSLNSALLGHSAMQQNRRGLQPPAEIHPASERSPRSFPPPMSPSHYHHAYAVSFEEAMTRMHEEYEGTDAVVCVWELTPDERHHLVPPSVMWAGLEFVSIPRAALPPRLAHRRHFPYPNPSHNHNRPVSMAAHSMMAFDHPEIMRADETRAMTPGNMDIDMMDLDMGPDLLPPIPMDVLTANFEEMERTRADLEGQLRILYRHQNNRGHDPRSPIPRDAFTGTNFEEMQRTRANLEERLRNLSNHQNNRR